MRSFKKIVTSHFFERRFTGISRLLWDWRNTMNNLEFALEMKNKRLASGLSQGGHAVHCDDRRNRQADRFKLYEND